MNAAAAAEPRAALRRWCGTLAAAAVSCALCGAAARAEAPDLAASVTTSEAATDPGSATPPAQPPPAAPRVRASADARACFQRAQAAYVAGDLAAALRGFLCAYRAAPSPELHFNLARVYERMGEADESIAHYQAYLAATQVTPKERKRIAARLSDLQALRERQRAPFAEAKLSSAALSAEARVFYDRGVKLFRSRQYEAALAAFSAALQMSSAPELHFNLAVVSERLNRAQQAIDHYRAYLAARSGAGDREQIEAHIALLQSQTP